MSDVRDYPAWFEILDKVPAARRLKMVAQVIADIVSYRGSRTKKADTVYLSEQLKNEKEFDLIGFVPGVDYMKVDGSDNDRIYHHNFGVPTLLYAHKRLPIIVMTNAFLRKDKNVLSENPDNDVEDVRGITG